MLFGFGNITLMVSRSRIGFYHLESRSSLRATHCTAGNLDLLLRHNDGIDRAHPSPLTNAAHAHSSDRSDRTINNRSSNHAEGCGFHHQEGRRARGASLRVGVQGFHTPGCTPHGAQTGQQASALEIAQARNQKKQEETAQWINERMSKTPISPASELYNALGENGVGYH